MNNKYLLTTAVMLGFSSYALAGDSEVAPIETTEPHNPWTLEASLLYMYAEGSGTDSHYEGQDHEPGYRFMIGYQPSAESFGYSITYTDFDGTDDIGEKGPDFHTFDFEVTTAERSYKGVDYTYSFGLRYMDLEEPFAAGYDVDYDGFGPVVGVSGTYDLPGNFALYGEIEASMLIGTDKIGYVPNQTYTYALAGGVVYDLSSLLDGSYVKLGYEYQRYLDMAYEANHLSVDGLILTLGCDF